ncbi:MAG: hypothetical protein R2797_06085 [Gelidibacter sp.]
MKTLKLLLVLILLTGLSCSENEDDSSSNTTVTLEASGLNDGKLSINNYATFTAAVDGYEGDDTTLIYRWSITTERGELSDGTTTLPNPIVTENTIRCYGRIAGDEQITVQVLDANNTVIATESMDFTIVAFVDPPDDLGCFDQPKLIYQYGTTSFYVSNFDGSDDEYLGEGGLSVAISPNGQWIAFNKYEEPGSDIALWGYYLYVKRCDSNESIMIPNGTGDDFLPQFSSDSQTLYFLRPNPAQPNSDEVNGGGLFDLVAYDIETGNLNYLTNLYPSENTIGEYTVSPTTNEIAFMRKSYIYFTGGYEIITKLSTLNPQSGLITDLMTLSVSPSNYGMDWSPNGEDIIFSASGGTTGRGIYRVNIVDGLSPQKIFDDPSPQSLPPLHPHFYANGTRIAWDGQENGQNNSNIWSIDANGADLQQLTNTSGNETLEGILE